MRGLIFGLVVATTGCSTVYPVYLRVEPSGEEFVGKATSSMGTSGFTVNNGRGTECSGVYKAPLALTPRSVNTTEGDIRCDDGRTGTWVVTGTTQGGQGVGDIEGEKLKVYFGDVVVKQALK